MIVLLIIIPLIISSIAFFWEQPAPKQGPSGADRFSQFNPLMPKFPKPPNIKPPVQLSDILNYTVARVDEPDVFLRLRSGDVYRDGTRYPRYITPTTTPSTALPPGAYFINVRRNTSVSALISRAMGIPVLVGSNILYPSNSSVAISDVNLEADALWQLYPGGDIGVFTYRLGISNSTDFDRKTHSFALSIARNFERTHPWVLNGTPTSDAAYNIAQTLKLPDDATIYEQVGTVLSYMYAHIQLQDVNLTNPLDSLTTGKASPKDRLTTFVVLLRLTGVPANIAYGFMPENTTDETGLYPIKVKDFRMFVEVYDMNTRIFFDPLPSTALLFQLSGKKYPVNVYPVETSAKVVDVKGGDYTLPVNGTEVPVFDVNSTDYQNRLNVTTYAEVMGSPIGNAFVNATRATYEGQIIASYPSTSNSTGYAQINIEITYNNSVGGINLLYISYNGYVLTAAIFYIKAPTVITPFSDAMALYAGMAVKDHEEVR